MHDNINLPWVSTYKDPNSVLVEHQGGRTLLYRDHWGIILGRQAVSQLGTYL